MRKLLKKIITFLSKTTLLNIPKALLYRIISYELLQRNGAITYYSGLNRDRVFSLIRQIREETDPRLNPNEAYNVFRLCQQTLRIEGVTAEVGVYTGASAKLICEAKDYKDVYLFDTFEGLPQGNEIDDDRCYIGRYAASKEAVSRYLEEYFGVYIFEGLFPETADSIRDNVFAFVHIDVDLYQSTIDCLKFFYPRMSQDGIILVHDYPNSTGTTKAVQEFFTGNPEFVIEISSAQAMVQKR